MKTRIISGILALLLIAVMFVGCANRGNDSETTADPSGKTDNGETTDNGADTTNGSAYYELPSTATLSIKDYIIYNFAGGSPTLFTSVETTSDGMNGDPINDAIFKRNAKVEEAYGVVIKNVPYKASEQTTVITNLVASDEVGCHLILCNMTDAATLAIAGSFYDLKELDNISLEKVWWDQSANYQLRMGDALYFTYNEFFTSHYDSVRCMFFNKTLATSNEIDDIFATVKSGDWTVEKMYELAKECYSDKTGDGASEDDIYPFIGVPATSMSALMSGCGASYIQIDENGYPSAYFTTERFSDVYGKLVGTMFRDNFFYMGAKKNVTATDMFTAGKGLYLLTTMGMAKSLRAGECKFGIIPLPKYDTEQKEYICNAPNPYAVMIPANLTETVANDSAFVIEALAYQSGIFMRPTYFDVMLAGKTASDPVSAEMLDIIFANIAYKVPLDTSVEYATEINNSLVEGKDSISSYVDSVKTAIGNDITAYIAKYNRK